MARVKRTGHAHHDLADSILGYSTTWSTPSRRCASRDWVTSIRPTHLHADGVGDRMMGEVPVLLARTDRSVVGSRFPIQRILLRAGGRSASDACTTRAFFAHILSGMDARETRVVLNLHRSTGERIIIIAPDGTEIVITVLDITRRVRLGVSAPREYKIWRDEVIRRMTQVKSGDVEGEGDAAGEGS